MKTKLTKKQLFSVLSLILAFLFIVSGVFIYSDSHSTNIIDEQVPLAGAKKVAAEFYINNTRISSNNISFLFCKSIGSGQIYQPTGSITKLSGDQLTSLVCSEPNTSRYVKSNQAIKWVKIYYSLRKYRIIGEIVDVPQEEAVIVPSKSLPALEEVVKSQPTVDPEVADTTSEAVQETSEEPVAEEPVIEAPAVEETVVETPVAEVVAAPPVEESISTEIDFNTRTTVALSRGEILSAAGNAYSSNDVLQWDSFRLGSNDVADGRIPTEWLNDPVYLSMNLPSESVSDYMTSIKRDNAHIIGTVGDAQSTAVSMGALYQTTGTTLPETFTVCLGKIKLFAFSKSQNDWIVLDAQPYPTGVFVYTLPWTNTTSTKCQNVTYFDDHIEVQLTAEEMTGNVLHFWGKRPPVDKSDYLYYAAAYEFWLKDSSANGCLTATIGIDAKDANGGNVSQLFSSRGLNVTTSKKVHWGHTIPNSEYSTTRDGARLQQLY